MEIEGKTIVVTGAGSGIGRSLVDRFVTAGAKTVIAADIDAGSASETAKMFGAIAIPVDVSDEWEVSHLIEATETRYGPIDIMCSNAGIVRGNDEQSESHDWQKSWDVNVMGHVYAARFLIPRMAERGGGYFLQTLSAAALLNSIGGAPYGVTKYAALSFAEWLAITYRDKGIKVSVLCPQAVRTALLEQVLGSEILPGSDIASKDGVLEAAEVADCAIQGIRNEDFLILPHPEVLTYWRRKASNYDRWLRGMNRLQRSINDEAAN